MPFPGSSTISCGPSYRSGRLGLYGAEHPPTWVLVLCPSSTTGGTQRHSRATSSILAPRCLAHTLRSRRYPPAPRGLPVPDCDQHVAAVDHVVPDALICLLAALRRAQLQTSFACESNSSNSRFDSSDWKSRSYSSRGTGRGASRSAPSFFSTSRATSRSAPSASGETTVRSTWVCGEAGRSSLTRSRTRLDLPSQRLFVVEAPVTGDANPQSKGDSLLVPWSA